jgi:hypothetical protein
LKGKKEDVIGEDQFGFRTGKFIRDAIRILRVISDGSLDLNTGVCVFAS